MMSLGNEALTVTLRCRLYATTIRMNDHGASASSVMHLW
jgi:hypothetical protein